VNQFRIEYIDTWKCQEETPCVAILNKNVIFFFYKIREQEGRTGPVWSGRLTPVGGEGCGERERRVNMVQILCPRVCKWKNGTCSTIPGMGEGIRESDGGGEFNYIYLIHFKNFGMPQCTPPPIILKEEKS
jgi:hypothetical protein